MDLTDTSKTLWRIISPVLLLLGTVGNVLCITVMLQRKTRRSSTAVYLVALAVSDLVVLYTGLLRWWIMHLQGPDVRILSDAGCKAHWFLLYASTETSSWILVALTLERIISTRWPHKVKFMCTSRTAGVTVTAVVSSIMMANSHILIGVQLNKDTVNSSVEKLEGQHNNGSVVVYSCDSLPNTDYHYFFYFIWPWFDFALYYFLPMVILSIGEVIIIHRLIQSRKLRQGILGETNFQYQATVSHISDKSRSVTVMLLIVNAVFLLCITPVSVYLIGRVYWIDPEVGTSGPHQMVWAIVNLLMYLNHSVNFILYFLSGTRFRHSVRELFNYKVRNQWKNSSSSTSDHKNRASYRSTEIFVTHL